MPQMTQMTKHQMILFVLACLMLGVGSYAQTASDEANKFFEDVFGTELKRALATPTSKDDLVLAKTLMGAVAQSKENPAMVVLLCQKAASLTEKHIAGADTALQALGTLLRKSPATASQTHQRIIAVHTLIYSQTPSADRGQVGPAYIKALLAQSRTLEKSGDFTGAASAIRRAIPLANAIRWKGGVQLRAQFDRLKAAQKSGEKIDGLKAKLKANPKDTEAAGELVKVYLVELNQPSEAAIYALLLPDGEMQQNVLLAATPIDELTEDQLMRLGMWYRSLGQTTASKTAALRMYDLSRRCLARFASVHKTQDLKRTRAKLLVVQLESKIAGLKKELAPRPAPDAGSFGSRISAGVVRLAGKPITLEAERAGKIVGGEMKVYKSGRIRFLSVAKRSGDQATFTRTPSKGRLLITVQVAKATRIRIQGHLNTPSEGSGNNSFFVAVVPGKQTDAPRFTQWEGPNKIGWTWMYHRTNFQLAAGINTIIIAAREEGAMMDKIRIIPAENR